jgi:hypothetical protein
LGNRRIREYDTLGKGDIYVTDTKMDYRGKPKNTK